MVIYFCYMQHLIDFISTLYTQWKGTAPVSVDMLPQSGSERRYFRLHGKSETVIGTYGANVPENNAFIYFSDHFKKCNLAIPEIFVVSEDR